MRKSNEQSIREVISELLESRQMKGKLTEVNVINKWEEIVGTMIARNTQKIYFKNGKLYLHIDSPVLRNELAYTRSKIVEVVNKFAGEELIEDVVVR